MKIIKPKEFLQEKEYMELVKDYASKTRPFFNLDYETFREKMIKNIFKIQVFQKEDNIQYIEDDLAVEVMQLLFAYSTGNEDLFFEQAKKFKPSIENTLNLQKGLLFIGSYGVGKSLFLNSLANLYTQSNIRFMNVFAPEFFNIIAKNGYEEFKTINLNIDDLGKEYTTQSNDFGTVSRPLVNLLNIRHNYGALTFASSNNNFDSLNQFYGGAIADRFKKTFNILEIKGKSKRI